MFYIIKSYKEVILFDFLFFLDVDLVTGLLELVKVVEVLFEVVF